MTSEGRFYKEKLRPELVVWLDKYYPDFFEYITIIKERIDGLAFEQTIPLAVNCLQSLDNAAGDKNFIASNVRGASGLLFVDDAKVQKIILTIVGSVVNTFAGTNALDCTTATHNQWQANLDNGAWFDLVNGVSPDGQMNDNDWRLPVQGGSIGIALSFDVTSQITNIDGKIGLRLQNGRAEQDGFQVTIGAYLTIIWGNGSA